MKRLSSILAFMLAFTLLHAAPGKYRLQGRITDASSGEPLAGVVVSIGEEYLWGVSGTDGAFAVNGIIKGRYTVKASCLGYVDKSIDLTVDKDIESLEIRMDESSLALKEVVVTSRRTDGISTSHTLGKDALNHLQMSSMTDMSALLPGGKTANPDLTSAARFSLRTGGSQEGNAAFGTAVEVDGVRLGNNAGFGGMAGVDTRSVPVDNVESVEVITGVPSAEYGDLSSGMVKIHTRKGRTPLNVTFSVNPRTYQASASKGIGLGDGNGVLNVSAEWARATKKLTSPYESYTRRGLSLAYSNTFAKVLRFEAGITGNLGGMDSKDDPDAFSGAFAKVHDNVLRGSTALSWQINRPWITSLKAEASLNYNDNLSLTHDYFSYASNMPAVHAETEGYHLADRLPKTFFTDQVADSRELDAAASLKYTLNNRWDEVRSNFKAGFQWKANGNAGEGEYYQDPSVAANGYRPRPYRDYPFMHNFSAYAEEDFRFPLGSTTVELTAGIRMENVLIKDSEYDDMTTFSPRFNVRWKLSDRFSVRGGWGVTEKLPSFYILYPKPEYRDIQTFGFSHGDGSTTSYIYYTQPYAIQFNPGLRWQRNRNSELGLDFEAGGFKVALVGFINVTSMPYRLTSVYSPFSYDILRIPDGYSIPADPEIRVDGPTGATFIKGAGETGWTQMDTKVTDRTFVKNTIQENGADITRTGAELTVDFPEIKPLRTSVRLDAAFGTSSSADDSPSFSYNIGWSHTTLADRSYQYVGIYANGGGSNMLIKGRKTCNADANLTTITHIPEARLIVTCRFELSILTRSLNIATASASGTASDLWPAAYMDLDGNIHEFTAEMAADPEFDKLILHPTNDYMFDQDGYGPYMSANLSLTKEMGDHVSLSFFINNFTNARPTVYSMATGVGTIFTPAFYYGLTCRLKF